VSPDPTGRAITLVDSLSKLDFKNAAPNFRVEAAITPP
jgi:hypothetical protein